LTKRRLAQNLVLDCVGKYIRRGAGGFELRRKQ